MKTSTQHIFDLQPGQSLENGCVILEAMDPQPEETEIEKAKDNTRTPVLSTLSCLKVDDTIIPKTHTETIIEHWCPFNVGQQVSIRQVWVEVHNERLASDSFPIAVADLKLKVSSFQKWASVAHGETNSPSTMPRELWQSAIIQGIEVKRVQDLDYFLKDSLEKCVDTEQRELVGKLLTDDFKNWFNEHFSKPRPFKCKWCKFFDGARSRAGTDPCLNCGGNGIGGYRAYVYDEDSKIEFIAHELPKYRDKQVQIIVNAFFYLIYNEQKII